MGKKCTKKLRKKNVQISFGQKYCCKTKNNISASKAREDLLGSVQRDIEEYRGMASTRQELYQRERDHLLSSDRLADNAIEMAR